MSTTLEKIFDDFRKQELKGIQTYGTTVDRDDYNHLMWLQEAKEEAMDIVIYLTKAIETLKQNMNEKSTNIQKETERPY